MNPVTIFVLWVYFAQPWPFGSINMTAGWVSVKTFWSEESCNTSRQNYKLMPGNKIVCLPGGEFLEPLSKSEQELLGEKENDSEEDGRKDEVDPFQVPERPDKQHI